MKKLVAIGEFEVRETQHKVEIYPFKGDKFYSVVIYKPSDDITLLPLGTKMRSAEVTWSTFSVDSIEKAKLYGKAIQVACTYAQKLNREAGVK